MNKLITGLGIAALVLSLGCSRSIPPLPEKPNQEKVQEKPAESTAPSQEKKEKGERRTIEGKLINIVYDRNISSRRFSFVIENDSGHQIISCKTDGDFSDRETLNTLALKEYLAEKQKCLSNMQEYVELRGVFFEGDFLCDYLKGKDYTITFR